MVSYTPPSAHGVRTYVQTWWSIGADVTLASQFDQSPASILHLELTEDLVLGTATTRRVACTRHSNSTGEGQGVSSTATVHAL